MVTKEQVTNYTQFIQVHDGINKLIKPRNWRANGKCKTWKRDLTRFSLPVKHGLYSYGYLTNENAHLFEVKE
jgi:hypothetical protein